MKDDFKDILARIPDEPIWWDVNGCPRYLPPADLWMPEHLMGRIRCQACGRTFWVALVSSVGIGLPAGLQHPRIHANIERDPSAKPDPSGWRYTGYKLAEGWHYGDPPRHSCPVLAGETMNSIPEYEWDRYFGEVAGDG